VVAGPDVGVTASVDFPVVVGRDGDVAIRDPTVSRKHVRVEPESDVLRVTDLDSAGGVSINGHRQRHAEVGAGDDITLGNSTVRVLRLLRYADAVTGPSFRVRLQGREQVVAVREGLSIGRDATCEIRIDDPTVSRRHAVIHMVGGEVRLEDLGSANGTRIGGRQVHGTATLLDGAVVQVGTASAQLTFSEGSSHGSVSVRVTAEGSQRVDTLEIDAGAEATVAEVTRELARYVSVPEKELLLYRVDDGVLLHPDDRWAATDARPGDQYVVGVGDASSFGSAPALRSTRRSTAVNQLPRTVWPPPAHVVERIDAPESTSLRGRGVLWQILGGIGAILIGLTLVVVNPGYAVFGIITGGIGIISIAASILGEQSRRRHRLAEFRRKLDELDQALVQSRERQSAAYRSLSPSIDELRSWITTSSPRIWERRPRDVDALCPTIGIGSRATLMEVERSRGNDSPFASELDAVTSRNAALDRVPVIGPGPSVGSLGVSGHPDRVRSLLAHMIIEAAALHPPGQLRIWVAATTPGWEWTRWLPHIGGGGPSSDASGAADLLAGSAREMSEPNSGTLHLVVVPESSRRMEMGGQLAAARGEALFVVGSVERRDLPSGLAVVLDIDSHGGGTVVGVYPDVPLGAIEVAGVDERTAEELAIAIGRLGGPRRQAAPSGLVELLGLGSATQPDVVGAWHRPPTARLTTAVGSDDTGAPVTIGFRRDGPHGMIAGTTGSGKSELLQTILTGLALRHSPAHLSLFLVDFKGGSTFAPLASLPHVVGLVTDLEHDSSLATRALTALDAEIDRRKRLLEAARVPDVIAYERMESAEHPPLADLLVVIDEFALLVERQPDVRDRLDTIATQGRSLGIHLLLATQSPSGVISHAIRTNTNLWICLRVVTESESLEILGTRDAARIPDGSPGRAIIRLGAAQDLRTFQAARIARPVPDAETPVRITRLGGGLPTAVWTRESRLTELDLVVAHICATAEQLALEPVTPLWLPPLPSDLPASDVSFDDRPADRLVALVGRSDHPRQHEQLPFVFDLSAAGHALVTGMFGFGKTTALRQIATDLAVHSSPADVHVYGIDGGAGALAALTALPHVGDVVAVNDVERLTRLIDRLTRIVETRRDQLATSGTGSFLRWRTVNGTPWVVLLVDDYAAFREVAEQVELGRLLERFNSLLQNGPAVGVHLVVAATQAADLRTREVNVMLARLVLRASDVADYGLVDARFAPREGPGSVAGRGLAPGAVEVQVCRPDTDDIAEVVQRWAHAAERAPQPVRRLPSTVDLAALPANDRGVVLGVGGPDVEPVIVPTDFTSTVLLVAGPSQSGRSTALITVFSAMNPDPSLVLVVATRPSPLRALAAELGATLHTTAAGLDVALDAFSALTGTGRVLVVDDAEAISAATGVSHRLEQLLREAPETGTSVLVSARVNDLPGMFDPWARYLMSLRRVVLLQPTVDDAFLFGIKLPVIPPPVVPGRGLFINRGQATVVQVATGGGS
jgi:S-DNA-T family DNA segregation ATPase FtsK/SpoIIIE